MLLDVLAWLGCGTGKEKKIKKKKSSCVVAAALSVITFEGGFFLSFFSNLWFPRRI